MSKYQIDVLVPGLAWAIVGGLRGVRQYNKKNLCKMQLAERLFQRQNWMGQANISCVLFTEIAWSRSTNFIALCNQRGWPCHIKISPLRLTVKKFIAMQPVRTNLRYGYYMMICRQAVSDRRDKHRPDSGLGCSWVLFGTIVKNDNGKSHITNRLSD